MKDLLRIMHSNKSWWVELEKIRIVIHAESPWRRLINNFSKANIILIDYFMEKGWVGRLEQICRAEDRDFE